MAVVSIKSLSTESVIGIYPHELEKPQPLVFDVDMETDISAAGESDAIEDALDYARVADRISELARRNKKKLLESLVTDISRALMHEFPAIERLTLCVLKPQALEQAAGSRICLDTVRDQRTNKA